MLDELVRLFEDQKLVERIQKKLPYLFRIAELENSRAGRVGMEVGSARERIIVALLMYVFGEEDVLTDVPITEPEVDVMLFEKPLSIKTITGLHPGGVKLIWTVDAEKAREFAERYSPRCDMLLVQVCWGNYGGLYYIPLEAQVAVFERMGRNNYIRLPKPGTNPRGVEIAREALALLLEHDLSREISIFWHRVDVAYNPYKRWLDLWRED